MLFHKGERFQSGRGLGALFSGLFRTLKPLFSIGISAGNKALQSQAAKTIGSTALDIGKQAAKNLAADLLEGNDMGESLNKELQSAKNIIASKIRGSGRKRHLQISDNTLKDILARGRKKGKYSLI